MKRKIIRLAVLDGHQSMIDALKEQLLHHQHLKVLITATSPGELLCQLTNLPAGVEMDLILADDTMLYMNEDELADRFKELFPHLTIVAWLANNQNDIVVKMIKEKKIAGAVLKNGNTQKLVETLEKIDDKTYFREKVLQKMPKVRIPKKASSGIHLTERELEIIRLIDQEYNNKQIAQTLYISERTVETHRKNIFRKTKTNSVIGLIKYVYEHKLV